MQDSQLSGLAIHRPIGDASVKGNLPRVSEKPVTEKEVRFEGRPLVNGIAIGAAIVIDDISNNNVTAQYISADQVDSEIALLDRAIAKVISDYDNDDRVVEFQKLHKKQIVCQTARVQGIKSLITDEHYNCSTAIRIQFRHDAAKFTDDSVDLLADLKQAQENLLCAVSGTKSETLERLRNIKEKYILCAQNLSAEVVYAALEGGLCGICIGDKGNQSHFRIVAESHSIPVLSLERSNIASLIEEGTLLLLDTQGPHLYKNPKAETLARYEHDLATTITFDEVRIVSPLLTIDGRACHVLATVSDFDREPARALELGAEGLGLMRSEIAFFQAFEDKMPSQVEPELTEKYITLFQQFSGKPIHLRTFDFAGDKCASLVDNLISMHIPASEREAFNDDQHIAKHFIAPQIRAILRASVYHDTPRLYFPQIGTSERFLRRSNFVEQQKGVLDALSERYNPDIQIGAMIESVEGVDNIERIIKSGAKFICIGSNDLLASITGGSRLGDHLFPGNPALLRVLMRANIPNLENKYNVDVSLCGNLAKAAYTPFTIALGIRNIAALASEYGILAEMMASLTTDDCDKLLLTSVEEESDTVIRNLLSEAFRDKVEVHW